MPGYRFGIAERISVYPVRAPFNSKIEGIPAQNLRWFEEAVVGQKDGLPSARFALQIKGDDIRVIYGEQCLSPELCIAWQPWPVAQ